MNKTRRKELQNIISKLNTCSEELTSLKEDEDFSRENIPENLQNGETYTTSEECSDKIDSALSDIQQAVSTLEDV